MMMKIRHKKIVASGTAVALAGILGVGTLLHREKTGRCGDIIGLCQ